MKLYLPAWLARRIIDSAKRRPFTHLAGYMNRYWFVPRGGRLATFLAKIGSRWRDARVHEILRSDLDRHLHDHPWDYRTIILDGSYIEVTQWDSFGEATRWAEKEKRQGGVEWDEEMRKWELRLLYTRGCVLTRPAGFAHRLIVAPGQVATTLFIMGEKQEGWGFYTPEGKVPHDEYPYKNEIVRPEQVS